MAADPGRLHRDAVVVDAHNDLLLLVAARGPGAWAPYFRARWLPQLRAGGVDVQVLPVYVDREFLPEGALRRTLRLIETAHRVAEGNADAVALCLTGEEIDRAVAGGRIALVLALEGCPAIDEDVELLQTLRRLGVRIASFTHFGRTALADGSSEDAAGSRLPRAGVAALAEMERVGVLCDVSHLGRAGVEHVLELATRPVIATHSSARALCDHHRNLPDALLRGIAAGGGVICVNLFHAFIDPQRLTVDRVVDHIEHVAEVAGIEHVGIGPDFVKELMDERHPLASEVLIEGLDSKKAIPGLEGPAGLPLVTETLVARGFAEADVRRVLGENALRLFRETLGRPGAPAATGRA